MRTRTTILGTLAGLALLTACGGGDEESTAENKPSKTPSLSAQGMVDQLTDLYPLANPRDNTGSCDTGKDHPNDCRQLITTDPVSVYELKTEKAAAHWAKTMGRSQETVQAGRFMLLWWDKHPTDKDAKAEMTAKAQEIAEGE
ncbi:hypothetical protein ACFYMH_17310 [Streptomyces albidoflavus]